VSFTNLATGHSHSFGGEFLELVPNEPIRHTDQFDDPNLPGQMQTTVSLRSALRSWRARARRKRGARLFFRR
jgi:uncharacterized protein YndB with AHSA1/START domain